MLPSFKSRKITLLGNAGQRGWDVHVQPSRMDRAVVGGGGSPMASFFFCQIPFVSSKSRVAQKCAQ